MVAQVYNSKSPKMIRGLYGLEIFLATITALVSLGLLLVIVSPAFELDVFSRISNIFAIQVVILLHAILQLILALCAHLFDRKICEVSERTHKIVAYTAHALTLYGFLIMLAAGLYYSPRTNPTTPVHILPFITFADSLATTSLQVNWYHIPYTSLDRKLSPDFLIYLKDLDTCLTLQEFEQQEDPSLWVHLPVITFNHTHHTLLSGLQPGRRYFYKVSSFPNTFSLITPASSDYFTFSLVSDTHTRYGVNIRLKSLLQRDQPDFVVHAGDFVNQGGDLASWRQIMGDHGFFHYLQSRPLLVLCGNHETYANMGSGPQQRELFKSLFFHHQVIRRRFLSNSFSPTDDQIALSSQERQYPSSSRNPDVNQLLPQQRNWTDLFKYLPAAAIQYYDPTVHGDIRPFDEGQYLVLEYGNTVFIALDSMEDYIRQKTLDISMGNLFTPEQLKWLNKTLTSYSPTTRPDIKFRILMNHMSLYKLNRHTQDPTPLAVVLEPYICQYGIDLYISGHTHYISMYKRANYCREKGYPDHLFYQIGLGSSGGTPGRILSLLDHKFSWPSLETTTLTDKMYDTQYAAADFVYGGSYYLYTNIEVFGSNLIIHLIKISTGSERFRISISKHEGQVIATEESFMEAKA